MPMPLWWGHVNKRVFNRKALRDGEWAVLTHVGRSSGQVYRTPLGAEEVDGTVVFILVYGSRCDWAQNVLAAGSGSLELDDEIIELNRPRVVNSRTSPEVLDGIEKPPPAFLKIDEFLVMDVVSRQIVVDGQTRESRRPVT